MAAPTMFSTFAVKEIFVPSDKDAFNFIQSELIKEIPEMTIQGNVCSNNEGYSFLRNIQDQFENLQAKFATTNARLQDQIGNLQAEFVARNAQHENLQAEFAARNAQHENLQAEFAARNANLQDQIGHLQAEFAARNVQHENLQAESATRNANLQDQIGHLQAEFTTTNARLVALEGDVKYLRRDELLRVAGPGSSRRPDRAARNEYIHGGCVLNDANTIDWFCDSSASVHREALLNGFQKLYSISLNDFKIRYIKTNAPVEIIQALDRKANLVHVRHWRNHPENISLIRLCEEILHIWSSSFPFDRRLESLCGACNQQYLEASRSL